MEYFQYGLLTPVLAFVMACVGGGLGVRCLVRAVGTRRMAKRGWLVTGAVAIGAGVWTMHLIAMLGFGVEGSPVRYDVPLTLLSLLVAVVFAGLGIVAAGYSRPSGLALLLGGVGVGVGIAGMHYVGMAAIRMHGTMSHDPTVAAMPVLLAVGVATIAIWVAFRGNTVGYTLAAALLMGIAATGTQYSGIAVMRVEVMPGTSILPGASALEFVFPLIVIFGSFLFLSTAFVALSPTRQQATSRRALETVQDRAHLVS